MQFSRKHLGIPYAVFLLIFVAPLCSCVIMLLPTGRDSLPSGI